MNFMKCLKYVQTLKVVYIPIVKKLESHDEAF